MSDHRNSPFAERHDAGAAQPLLAELVEVAARRIMTAIVIAGALIGLAIYSQDSAAPRYQVTAADGRIIRVNTESGTVIACEGEVCAIVLQRGQDLDDELPAKALPAPAAQPAPALPAPAADNAAAAAPAAR